MLFEYYNNRNVYFCKACPNLATLQVLPNVFVFVSFAFCIMLASFTIMESLAASCVFFIYTFFVFQFPQETLETPTHERDSEGVTHTIDP